MPPTFNQKYENVHVRVNEPITLQCPVSGDRPIQVRWLINEKPLGPQPSNADIRLTVLSDNTNTASETGRLSRMIHSLSADDLMSNASMSNRSSDLAALYIESAHRQHSALYTCQATNRFGTSEWRVQLTVEEPPSRPDTPTVVSIGSRSAQFNWQPPYNGNSDITKYWITCHSGQPGKRLF